MFSRTQELIDCHARLQHAAYAGQGDAAVGRAQRAGVSHVVCTTTCERDWSLLLDLAIRTPAILPCFGWDPARLADRPRDWQHKLQLVMNTGSAGIGMIGLDRSVRECSISEQMEVLTAQLTLAGQLQRPVILRCARDAERLTEVLERLDKPPSGIMWLDFAGPIHLVERLVRVGVYFCYSGTLLYPKYSRMKRILRAVPLDRLLMATDAPGAIPPPSYAPYQALDADRHPVNEPANLPYIVTGLATLMDQEPGQLAHMLYHNALCLFGALIPGEQ